MTQSNDERIIKLKNQIEEKKAELSKQNDKLIPKTNCLLVLDDISYNLHVNTSHQLLVKVNMMVMSAKDLGLDPDKFMISGYSLTDWLDDIKNYIKVNTYKEEKKKLDKLEKQLDNLLSDTKRTELEIDNIEAMI